MGQFDEQTLQRKQATLASLELVRGVASLGVFVSHVVLHTWLKKEYFWSQLGQWGHPMVVIFFVLSGYVIALAMQRLPRTPGSFLWARLKRIEPLYLIALAVALAITLLWRVPVDPLAWTGFLFFLQSWHGFVSPLLFANGPLWSLGTEMQFYLLFAFILWLGPNRGRLIWWSSAWLALIFWMLGFRPWGIFGLAEETLALSLIWLLGNTLARQKSRYALPMPQAAFIFGSFFLIYRTSWGNDFSYDPPACLILSLPAAFFLHSCAQAEQHPDRASAGISWKWLGAGYALLLFCAYFTSIIHWQFLLCYAMLPWFFLALATWPGWSTFFRHPMIRRCCLVAGKYSYALYVIHFPIIICCEMSLAPGLFQLLCIFSLTLIATFTLEYWVQPRAVRLMEKIRDSWREKTRLPQLEPSR